jgi:hypothetical protein
MFFAVGAVLKYEGPTTGSGLPKHAPSVVIVTPFMPSFDGVSSIYICTGKIILPILSLPLHISCCPPSQMRVTS